MMNELLFLVRLAKMQSNLDRRVLNTHEGQWQSLHPHPALSPGYSIEQGHWVEVC